ncbi:hypothetical protein LBMAG10_11610 [Actinomycetes bacterium]|nr:hypothetical protein LBMAG10_11610 [Actinomycetes bacterium]
MGHLVMATLIDSIEWNPNLFGLDGYDGQIHLLLFSWKTLGIVSNVE